MINELRFARSAGCFGKFFIIAKHVYQVMDLPTLLRPIKAYSGLSGLGHCSYDGDEIRYLAECMIRVNFFMKQTNKKTEEIYSQLSEFMYD